MSNIITKDLSFAYKTNRILNHVDLELFEGEILVILGPNGIGKSTLLNCLSGVLKNYTGHIKIDGHELSQISSRELSHKLALVSQGVNIDSKLTLSDYLLLGRSSFHSIFGQPDKKDEILVKKILTEIGLESYRDVSLQDMSGGQKQLAVIGRALVQEPAILIMDEPTSALDYKNQVKVLKLIQHLAHQNISIIMSTHDPNHAMMIGDKVGLINSQRDYQQGNVDEILSNEHLSKLYQVPILSTYSEELKREVFGIGMNKI